MRIYWRWISIIFVCGAIGLPGPAFAEDTVIPAAINAIPANDGPLPIYPGVSLPANGFPANFWSSGAYRETTREGCHTNKQRRIWGVHE
jgi:hypothetical protein